MAYDGWHNSPGPYDQLGNNVNMNQNNPEDPHLSSYPPPPPLYPSQYPSQYGPDRVNMPYPQMPPPSSSPSNPNPNPEPYQEPGAWQQPQQQPHPGRINEAVNSMLPNADPSSYIPPEVLSQITANVIQQLRATGLQGQQQPTTQSPQQAQQPQWPPPPPNPPASSSPHSYTQPSPAMNSGHGGSPSPLNIAPESAGYQPRPPSTVYPSSPYSGSRPSPVPSTGRRDSPESVSSDHGQKGEGRPGPPSRNATVMEMTTLEKIWGKLFDDGKPTKRLGQFLRGIAVHLIEDYPPENTLVIVPEKLQKFYKDTNISSDPYPWQDIFDDRTSSISRLFRELEVEHHLVQAKLSERPDIPGLTPRGFERWATLMILAHPEREFKRLQEAVLNMPISNPDDKKERFPKEIPRRLFPETPDLAAREDMDQFIRKHCGVDLPQITDEEFAKAAAHRRKASSSSTRPTVEHIPAVPDRGRQSHSRPASVVIDDDDEEERLPSRPIERERKPYTAQPGGGKVYDEAGEHSRGHSQSFSTGSGNRPPEFSTQEPLYPRTGSAGAHRPIRKVGRSRSSSRGLNPGGDYRHSDGDLLGHNNGGSRHARMSSAGGDYYLSSSSNLPGGISEESRRYDDRESEEKRLYESLREREREREKSKYHDHMPHRPSWADDEDYYRGMGTQNGGPVGGAGYDYKTYSYR